MQLMNLKTKVLGKCFKYYETIDSTQLELWRLIKNKQAKNGELIIAEYQTGAIGTHGRVWYTDKGNIAFSFYIETNCSPVVLDGITIEIAQIFVDIFKEKYNLKIDIKSPNDLILNGKKIGGILTEAKSYKENVKFLVIGIGININKMNFEDDIKDIATSIKKESGKDVECVDIVSEFCNIFEKKFLKRMENY